MAVAGRELLERLVIGVRYGWRVWHDSAKFQNQARALFANQRTGYQQEDEIE